MATLEQRALQAAVAVAAARGLSVDGATIIHSDSNVLVHLRPAPVVARVMTGTVALHDDPRTWLEREVAVLTFLASSGLAVVPSRSIAPGPHCHDGMWMTFTEWIADLGPAPEARLDDPRGLGETLRALHDALVPFAGELAGLHELREDIERLLGRLRAANMDERAAIASLGARLDRLGEEVFESTLPAQPLHGDVSLRNLLGPPQRPVWNDFEDTFAGPVHWDLASFVGSLRGHGATERCVREMLDGYGLGDERALAPFLAVQDVYDAIWRMYDRQRRRPSPTAR